jgi:glycine/D-amino acid oxidase-like deaminating enzyme
VAPGPGAAFDVAVVGGGIVGSAAAAFLAEAGATVALIERESIAAAASGRNSGVVQQPLDPILGELYRETVALYRDVGESDGFALPRAPAGLLYVSRRKSVAAGLATELAASHPELSPAYLDGPALQALEPALAPAVAACRLDIGFPVAPGAATRAFAARATRAGATLLVGEPGRIAIDGDRAAGVEVGGVRIAAGAVVVAAGPWTPQLIDPAGRWRPIQSLWGVVADVDLAAAPRHVLEEAEIDATIEPDRGAPAAGSGMSFSLVTAGGASSLGSTFLADEPDDAAFAPALVAHGAMYVPAIEGARVRGTRRCARPLSLDGRPLVGPVPWIRRLFVVAGHGPWGISTGPATARMVADVVLGRDAGVPAALDPARFGSA